MATVDDTGIHMLPPCCEGSLEGPSNPHVALITSAVKWDGDMPAHGVVSKRKYMYIKGTVSCIRHVLKHLLSVRHLQACSIFKN